jgi:hypothetical protein
MLMPFAVIRMGASSGGETSSQPIYLQLCQPQSDETV